MNRYSRRAFIQTSACGICAGGLAIGLAGTRSASAADVAEGPGLIEQEFGDDSRFVREAQHFEPLDGNRVRCVLCPRRCQVADRERGYCGVRENRGGKYYTLVYGRIVTAHVDPIEKKPLSHYLPGARALSVATAGCNLTCSFCQNWNLSQSRPEDIPAEHVTPERLVAIAKDGGIECIAHTYNEPVIFYEYVRETGQRAKEAGVGNIVISNGFYEEKALRDLIPSLSAIKIDLKAFTDAFYREQCGGALLAPILRTLRILKESGIWFEIVVLLIPTLNDSEEEIRKLAGFVSGELSPDVPVHFSRFRPHYKLQNLPPTPVSTLDMARRVSMEEGLRYVYVGNVTGSDAEDTFCHNCKTRLINRYGYRIIENRITDEGNCPDCGTKIPGVWK